MIFDDYKENGGMNIMENIIPVEFKVEYAFFSGGMNSIELKEDLIFIHKK